MDLLTDMTAAAQRRTVGRNAGAAAEWPSLGRSNCAEPQAANQIWPSSKVAWKSRPSSLGRFFTDFIAVSAMKSTAQESRFKVKERKIKAVEKTYVVPL